MFASASTIKTELVATIPSVRQGPVPKKPKPTACRSLPRMNVIELPIIIASLPDCSS